MLGINAIDLAFVQCGKGVIPESGFAGGWMRMPSERLTLRLVSATKGAWMAHHRREKRLVEPVLFGVV